MNLFLNLLTSVVDSSSGDTTANPLGNILIWVIPIGLLILFWVMQSRQRKKQQQEIDNKMSNLKVGDVVKTIGLIYGEIVEIDREMETFVLKTGSEENPSYIKVDKMAIYQVIPPLAQTEDIVELNEDETSTDEVFEETVETNQSEGQDKSENE